MSAFSNLRVHFVCQQLVPLNLTSMEDNAEGEEFSARNFAHIHNSSANVLSGEVFNPKYLPSNMMLYPVKGNGRPNTSYGYLKDTKMSRYVRLNEHMNKTVEAGLFPEDFEDSSQGEKFIQIMRQKGKPAKVFSSMANVYSNKKSQKLSAVKRMNRMLNAGIVTAKDGDFDKVDNFLLNGVLNAVGRPGGKASNEKIVSKILCHDKI